MNLLELFPRMEPRDGGKVFQELIFLCPKCRKHEIAVATWAGAHQRLQVGKMPDGEPDIRNLWHIEGESGFHDVTLTPSINRENLGDPCGGWHGNITSGEIT